MIQAPGGNENGFLALTLVDTLIETLRDKGVLSDAEVAGLLERALRLLENDHRSVAQGCAPFVRQTLQNYRR